MKIYTKTGDKGKTSLFDGTRVRKDNIRVETYGTVDELNSVIGIVISEISNFAPSQKLKSVGDKFQISNKQIENQKSKIKNQRYKLNIKNELEKIQNNLFDIGALLANPNKEFGEKEKGYFEKRVLEFEKLIDDMTQEMPELTNFILPGGSKAGALLQLARTVCRRTERRVISLSQEVIVPKHVIMFFNRLSDLLFTMSRYVNWIEGEKEQIWEKNI